MFGNAVTITQEWSAAALPWVSVIRADTLRVAAMGVVETLMQLSSALMIRLMLPKELRIGSLEVMANICRAPAHGDLQQLVRVVVAGTKIVQMARILALIVRITT